jgi:hypothetical protein
MKTRRNGFTAGLVFAVLLAGCAAPSPKAVVERFYRAVEKNDAKALAEAATPETAQLMAMFGEKVQAQAAANGKIASMTETIDGDTASVTVTFENGEKQNIDLVKVDGKWKVSISK